jgi:hypothetical protein
MREYFRLNGVYFATNVAIFIKEGGTSSPIAMSLFNLILDLFLCLFAFIKIILRITHHLDEPQKTTKINKDIKKQKLLTEFFN